jgi:hypothetical protein
MNFNPNDLMWVWWVPTVGLCAWKIIEGLIRPAKMLEWPFLACAMWGYFYGYMAYQAQLNLSAYLGNGMSSIGQFVPLISLIALLLGWSVGRRAKMRESTDSHTYPYGLAWVFGMGFLMIGTVGAYSVVEEINEGSFNYHTASAYWYLLFYVGYPGMALSIWAMLKMKTKFVYLLWAITLFGVFAFMLPHVLNARRGPLFPMIIVLLLVPPLTLRRPPSRLLYCGGLFAAALAMLTFLQVRTFTYNGATWHDALQHLDVTGAAVGRGEQADDNEYVISCQTIATIYQDGKYQYGTGHLELLVHWVPRALWWGKPVLGEGYYGFNELFDDVEANTGDRLQGSTGASSAGVADSFIQYGFLCPLYWFALAWAVGAVYARVIRGKSAPWLFIYVGFICASHWLISQNLAAAFVPFWFFESVPLFAFALFSLYRRAAAPPQKVRRRPRPAPVPPRAAPVVHPTSP